MRIFNEDICIVTVLGAFAAPAMAQTAATPWELKPDTGYAYDKEGKTFSYKMGTSNAGELLKGAKKVPKGTLFFIGQNGQLYMRSGQISKATASSSSGRIVRAALYGKVRRGVPAEPVP